MGSCTKLGLHRCHWTPEEDTLLTKYILSHGEGHWRYLPQEAGLLRCRKSCRLRWMNYLRPGIKRGNITPDEEDLIIRLHSLLGNRWSLIAGRLPGRTDNEIKNHWKTHISKRLIRQGTDPKTHRKMSPSPHVVHMPKAVRAAAPKGNSIMSVVDGDHHLIDASDLPKVDDSCLEKLYQEYLQLLSKEENHAHQI